MFCREPEEEEEASRLVPEAVIEVTSKGYAARDLELGAPFYIAQGVKDMVIFNPYTLVMLHIRKDHAAHYVSPVEIMLACGRRCTV
jgi:Uma2 family endonuclease